MVSFAALTLGEGVPIYLQIVRYLRSGIAAGTVRDGDEMPSRRVLSALLGVNPNTVQKAYRILEDEGLIQSRAGARSFVSLDEARAAAVRRALLAEGAAELAARLKAMGLDRDEALELIGTLWEEAEG